MATIPTYSQSLTTFVTSTMDAHQGGIIDQVFATREIMAYFAARRQPQAGGKSIFVNLLYGKSTDNVQRNLGRGSKIELSQPEIITQAQYFWQTYGGGVMRYRDDDLENRGRYEVFNLIQSYIENLTQSFQEVMETDIAGTGDGTNGWAGLQFLFEDVANIYTDTAVTKGSNTVGTINRASAGNDFWTNWGSSMSGLDPTVWLKWYLRLANDNVATYNAGGPEVYLTHRTVRNLWEDIVGQSQRLVNVRVGDVMIKTVEANGVPFLTSPFMRQTALYALGRDAVQMLYEPRMWFKNTGWKEPFNQPFDFFRQTVAKGSIVLKKPRSCSVVYNING